MAGRALTSAGSSAPLPRVAHVIDGYSVGGTESFVARLTGAHARRGMPQVVVTLRGCERLTAMLAERGVAYVNLAATRTGALAVWGRLRSIVADFAPDVVSGWLVHGNLLALALRSPAGRRGRRRVAVAWNIRQGLADVARERLLTRASLRGAAAASRRADLILYNSARGRAEHEAWGYAPDHAHVIPNGFDVEALRPDPEARAQLRSALGIDEATPVVGMAARFHPQKDHVGFLESFARVRAAGVDAHALLAGGGVTPHNPVLAERVAALGLEGTVHLLGERRDMRAVYSAMDLATLASTSEAFPNAIGEAMACGVPCVAPDVGDVRAIIGDTGTVVPVGDRGALADGITALLRDPAARAHAGVAARARIETSFSLDVVADRFADAFARARDARR